MSSLSVKKAHSGLSIVAFVFSLTVILSIVGVALAIFDLVKKNPNKKHVFSYIAIAVGALFSVLSFASCISNCSNESANALNTPTAISSKPIERGNVDDSIIEENTEQPQEQPDPTPVEKNLPTIVETERATTAPTIFSTEKPTAKPTDAPMPTAAQTVKPTEKPTAAPTVKLTEKPTAAPTVKPTEKPTAAPTAKPTDAPKPTADNQNKKNYVLNTSTMKFHYPSCRDVAKITDGNRSDFYGTREDIIERCEMMMGGLADCY